LASLPVGQFAVGLARPPGLFLGGQVGAAFWLSQACRQNAAEIAAIAAIKIPPLWVQLALSPAGGGGSCFWPARPKEKSYRKKLARLLNCGANSGLNLLASAKFAPHIRKS